MRSHLKPPAQFRNERAPSLSQRREAARAVVNTEHRPLVQYRRDFADLAHAGWENPAVWENILPGAVTRISVG
jgi:hypothetical protein